MQLVKLTYISNFWSTKLRNEVLFRSIIEEWEYGPNIPDLYKTTKSYGRKGIPLSKVGNIDEISVTVKDQQFLDQVFKKYGSYDGVMLSYLAN